MVDRLRLPSDVCPPSQRLFHLRTTFRRAFAANLAASNPVRLPPAFRSPGCMPPDFPCPVPVVGHDDRASHVSFESRISSKRLVDLDLIPHGVAFVIARAYSADELRSVIAEAEALLGESLDDLLQSWKLGSSSTTPPRYPHRFLDLLQWMRRASENPGNLIADDAAAVAAAEVSGLMQTFDGWREDPVWPEFQSAFQDPRNFLHAVVTLSMASALRERHQRTELVASGVQGGSADLRMVVTEHDWLAVEVKTSLALSNRRTAIEFSEALKFVATQLRRPTKGGRRQLGEDRPSMLVIGGVGIDNATFKALGDAAGHLLERGRRRPNLLAIVISKTFAVEPTVENGRVIVQFGHMSQSGAIPSTWATSGS